MGKLVLLSLGRPSLELADRILLDSSGLLNAHLLAGDLWFGFGLGRTDQVVLTESDSSYEAVLDEYLVRFGLVPGSDGGPSPDGSRLYEVDLQRPPRQARLSSFSGLCTLVLASGPLQPPPFVGVPVAAWNTTGCYDWCFLAGLSFDQAFSRVIQPLRRLGFSTYTVPAMDHLSVLHPGRSRRAKAEADTTGGVRLYPALTVAPGFETAVMTALRRDLRLPKRFPFAFTHGRRDLLAEQPVPVPMAEYFRKARRLRGEPGVTTTHTIAAVTLPDEAAPAPSPAAEVRPAPFFVPAPVGGHDITKRAAEIDALVGRVLERIATSIRGVCRDDIQIRYLPGAAKPRSQPAWNERPLGKHVTVFLSFDSVVDREWDIKVVHELMAAAFFLALDPAQQRLLGHGTLLARHGQADLVERLWRKLGEGVGTAVGLELFRHRKNLEGRYIKAYAELAFPGMPLTNALWTRLVLGEFLRRVISSGAISPSLAWFRELAESVRCVSQQTREDCGEAVRFEDFARRLFVSEWPRNIEVAHFESDCADVFDFAWQRAVAIGLYAFRALRLKNEGPDCTEQDSPLFPVLALSPEQHCRQWIRLASRNPGATDTRTFTELLEQFEQSRSAFLECRANPQCSDREYFAAYCAVGGLDIKLTVAAQGSREYFITSDLSPIMESVVDQEVAPASGVEILTVARPADERQPERIPLVPDGDHAAAGREVRFPGLVKRFVGRPLDELEQADQRDPLEVARILSLELHGLESSTEAITRSRPGDWSFASLNVAPWLLEASSTDPRLLAGYAESFLSLLAEFLKRSQERDITPIVEIADWRLPLAATREWEFLWELLVRARRQGRSPDGRMGLAVDMQFGKAKEIKHLDAVLGKAAEVGFGPLLIKVDYGVLETLLRPEVFKHDDRAAAWPNVFRAVGDFVGQAVKRVRIRLREPLWVVFEGHGGPDGDPGHRSAFLTALQAAQRQQSWPFRVFYQG
jgi:hypothetical protein